MNEQEPAGPTEVAPNKEVISPTPAELGARYDTLLDEAINQISAESSKVEVAMQKLNQQLQQLSRSLIALSAQKSLVEELKNKAYAK